MGLRVGPGWGGPGTDLWPPGAGRDPFSMRSARGGTDGRRKPLGWVDRRAFPTRPEGPGAPFLVKSA